MINNWSLGINLMLERIKYNELTITAGPVTDMR